MQSDRFQNQNVFVKLWRYRYYLYIPVVAVTAWWSNRDEIRFGEAWAIAVGLAQTKMKWYYTFEELKERWDWDN